MGSLPAALSNLTTAVANSLGQTAGPFLASIPSDPAGWSSYSYTPNIAAGTFTITNAGDGTTVSLP